MTNFEKDWNHKWVPLMEKYACNQLQNQSGKLWYVRKFWKWVHELGLGFQELEDTHFMAWYFALERGDFCHRTKSYKLSTLALFRGQVLAWMRYLTVEGHLLRNPFEDFSALYPSKSPGRPVLTPKQVKEILEIPNLETPVGLRNRAILEVAYGSGLRLSELARLTLHNVFLAERKLLLVNTKNGRDRVVPLTQSSCHFLKQYLKTSRPYLHSALAGTALWVSYHRTPLCQAGIKDFMYRYRKLTDFQFSLHDLRHACATHLLKGGASIVKIAALLGHQSLESTQIYTRVKISKLRRVHAKCHPRG